MDWHTIRVVAPLGAADVVRGVTSNSAAQSRFTQMKVLPTPQLSFSLHPVGEICRTIRTVAPRGIGHCRWIPPTD